jgi:hypothetical protein
MVLNMKVNGSEFIKTAELTNDTINTIEGYP